VELAGEFIHTAWMFADVPVTGLVWRLLIRVISLVGESKKSVAHGGCCMSCYHDLNYWYVVRCSVVVTSKARVATITTKTFFT
jgi:hypothetical protein